MNTVLHAVLLFVILATLALLLGQLGTAPMPVSLTINTLVLSTSAPIAIIFALALLLATFYLGRLTGWLLRLPKHLSNRRKLAVTDILADTYAALALNNLSSASQHLSNLKTDLPALQDLAILAYLQSGTLTPQHARDSLSHPRLTAILALFLARHAAAEANWPEVKRLTTLGRASAPTHQSLLTLQFKALVNLNDPTATELLPALKPLLGPTRHKLVSQIIQNNPTDTSLTNPWVKSFQTWLPTGSDTFPSEE